MPGHPVARVHADRRELAAPASTRRCSPALRSPAMPSGAMRADERLLDLPQIPVQILLVALEVDDRIADELSRAVEGDVAATLDLEQLDAARREQRRRREQMLLLRRAAQRDDRRMLDEEQHSCVDLAADPRPSRRARWSSSALRVRHACRGRTTSSSRCGATRRSRVRSSCRASRATPRRPLRTASGARGSPGRPLRPCTRSCGRRRARGSARSRARRRCARRGSHRTSRRG